MSDRSEWPQTRQTHDATGRCEENCDSKRGGKARPQGIYEGAAIVEWLEEREKGRKRERESESPIV